MIVEVTKIPNSGSKFELIIEPAEIDLETGFAKVSGRSLFSGKVYYSNLRTIVDGEIETEVELNCNRCLRGIPQELKFAFKNAYILAEDYTKEEENELEKEELEISIFEGETIDLKDVAGEQIALALPTQVICESDCKGLCEKCGANLNLIDCKCKEKDVDPRWSALKNLRIEKEK